MQRERAILSYRPRRAASALRKAGQGAPGCELGPGNQHHRRDNRPKETPMQLISFERAGRTGYGAVKDGGIVDLGATARPGRAHAHRYDRQRASRAARRRSWRGRRRSGPRRT